MKQKKRKSRNRRFIITLFFLLVLCLVFTIAPNYKREGRAAFTILYQNEDKTEELVQQEKIVGGEVYFSLESIQAIFGQEAYMDESNQWIVMTSETKVVAISIEKPIMKINSVEVEMKHGIIQEENHYYLPLSVMEQIDNLDITYIEETNRVVVDSKEKELIRAEVTKKVKVKQEKKSTSRTIETVKKGENIVWIENQENGWSKIRTKKGNIGYVKQKNLTNFYTVRENMEKQTEKVEKEVTSIKQLKKVKTVKIEDIETYEKREEIIENIVDQCVVNQVAVLEFNDTSLQEQNEINYTRFIKELTARLAEVGIELK